MSQTIQLQNSTTQQEWTMQEVIDGKKPMELMTTQEMGYYLSRKVEREMKVKHGPHPIEMWEKPENIKFMKEVLQEKDLDSDSEDEQGKPVYVKKKCPIYQAKYEKLKQKYLAKREAIINENKEKQKKNEELLIVPPSQYVPDNRDIQKLKSIEYSQSRAVRNTYEEMKVAMIEPKGPDYIANHDSNNPFCHAQVNLSLYNFMLPQDKRVEMAIIGQRERRRFNQIRRLGYKLPDSYKRIYNIKILPHYVQDELLKYPSAILDDSDYEQDEVVLAKYKDDPIKYITKNSQRHREQMEGKAEPRRLIAARIKKGDYPMKDIYQNIIYESTHRMLESVGIMRGMTEEKRLGIYKRPDCMQDEDFCLDLIEDYYVEVTKEFFDQYPNMFSDFAHLKLRDRLLRDYIRDRTKLKKYPEIVKAMFFDQEIPDDLKLDEMQITENEEQFIEENQELQNDLQQEIQISSENQNAVIDSDSVKIGELEASALMDEQQIDVLKQIRKTQKLESLRSSPQLKQEQVNNQQNDYQQELIKQISKLQVEDEKQAKPNQDYLYNDLQLPQNNIYPYLSKNQHDPNLEKLQILFESGSSQSSGDRSIIYAEKVQKLRNANLKEFEKQRNQQLQAYQQKLSTQFINIIRKLASDQIEKLINKFINTDDLRKLSRREQTDPMLWNTLSASASDSDKSLMQNKYDNEWLIAYQRLNAQKQIPMKKTKPERNLEQTINIDGVRMKWGEFKNKFYQDVNAKVKKGEKIKQREFILNQDEQNEKILYWHYQEGFYSENTDDERTNINRVSRKIMRKRKENHSQPYLRKREIKGFEQLMLSLGGRQILKQITGKEISNKITHVFDWQDPNESMFYSFGDFLLMDTKEECNQIYEQENQMQLRVLDSGQVKFSLFSHELEQLYLIFENAINKSQELWAQQLKQVLPSSLRAYIYDINFTSFISPLPSPKKMQTLSLKSFKEDQQIQFAQESFGQEQISQFSSVKPNQVNTSPMLSDKDRVTRRIKEVMQIESDIQQKASIQDDHELDYNQDKVNDYFSEVDNDLEQYNSKKSSPRSNLSAIKEVDKNKNKITKSHQPIIVIPKDDKPDFKEIRDRMIEFKETKFVDDNSQIQLIIKEQNLLEPQVLENEFYPRLDKLVKESDGRLKGYYIWPQHRVGGMEQIYPQGRRYPKRLKQYNYKQEDKAIFLHGVELGYMLVSIPFLHPECWKGTGIPLTNSTAKQKRISQQQFAKDTFNQIDKTLPTRNEKKRKRDSALKLGAGMDDYFKNEEMFVIEDKLPFLRSLGNPNCPFELIEIDNKHNNGNEYKITVALGPNRKIMPRLACSKTLSIINQYQEKKQLKLMIRSTSTSVKYQTKDQYIDNEIKIEIGVQWTLKNEGSQPIHINFMINK